MNISIRAYTDTDKSFYIEAYGGIYKNIAKIDPFQRQNWNAQNQELLALEELEEVFTHNGAIFLALENDEPIGLCMVSINPDNRFLQMVRLPAVNGKINILYVKESSRGKGVGNMLLAKGEEYLRELGCEYIDLVVFAANDIAHEMYKKHGYSDYSIDMSKKV